MNRKKGIRNFLKSMKFRLICLFMLIGILTGILIRTGILTAYEKHAVSNRSVDVIGQAKILANQMVSTDYINGAESESITSQLQQMSRVYDGRILLIDSSFHIIKDTYDLDTDKTIISEEVIKSFRGEDSMNYDVDNHYVEMTIPLTTDNVESGEKSIIGVLLISVSTDSILANLEYMRNAALVLQIFGAVFLFAVSVFLSVRLTNPLKNMASSIAEIQNGYGTSDGELMIKDYSETVQISEKFNKLYSRMKMLDDSRQEFVSNVSHELKTPLTSMKVLADSLNGQEDVPVELYREFMLDIGNEIERENKIINDLLSLVKMDKSASDLNITSVNINEMLDLILKRLKPIAEKLGIEKLLEKYPYEVSGGQKQRAAIARALITKPQLILADEPSGALDSKAADSLMNLFTTINQEGQTIVMVTHSVKAASSAKRVLFIKDGKVFHQLYRGNLTNEEMYERISDTLKILTTGGEEDE